LCRHAPADLIEQVLGLVAKHHASHHKERGGADKRAERFIEGGCFSLPIASISRLGCQVGRGWNAGGNAKSAKLASPVCQRVIGHPADLHVVAERVGHVVAVEAAVADVLHTERLRRLNRLPPGQ
jgi:hypothetical protein